MQYAEATGAVLTYPSAADQQTELAESNCALTA